MLLFFLAFVHVTLCRPCFASVLLINHVEVSCSTWTSEETWGRIVCWLQEIEKLPFPGGMMRRLVTTNEIDQLQGRAVKQKIQSSYSFKDSRIGRK